MKTIPPSPLAQKDSYHALHYAALGNSSAAILAILSRGPAVNVNARDAAGATPLHLTGRKNNVEAMEALLAGGAEKDVVDYMEGATAMHTAAGTTGSACVRALLKAGADAGIKDAKGNTPVHVAAAADNAGAVQEFIAAHVKTLLRNEARGALLVIGGRTPNSLRSKPRCEAPLSTMPS